jgi:hypothetical protein
MGLLAGLSFFAHDWGRFTPGSARESRKNVVHSAKNPATNSVPSPASSTGLRVAAPSTTTTGAAGDVQTATVITPAACRQPAAPCKDCSAQDHAARIRACLEALQPPPVHFPGIQTPRIGLLDGSGFVSDEGAWGGEAGVIKGKLPPTMLRRRNVTPDDVCLPGAPLQCLNSTGWLELPPPLSQSGPLGLAKPNAEDAPHTNSTPTPGWEYDDDGFGDWDHGSEIQYHSSNPPPPRPDTTEDTPNGAIPHEDNQTPDRALTRTTNLHPPDQRQQEIPTEIHTPDKGGASKRKRATTPPRRNRRRRPRMRKK